MWHRSIHPPQKENEMNWPWMFPQWFLKCKVSLCEGSKHLTSALVAGTTPSKPFPAFPSLSAHSVCPRQKVGEKNPNRWVWIMPINQLIYWNNDKILYGRSWDVWKPPRAGLRGQLILTDTFPCPCPLPKPGAVSPLGGARRIFGKASLYFVVTAMKSRWKAACSHLTGTLKPLEVLIVW